MQNVTYGDKRTTHCNINSLFWAINRSSRPEVFCKKGVLKNWAEAYDFIKEENLTQVFSYEFCEFFQNTFFDRTSLVAASESRSLICQTRTVWATRTKHMQRGMLLFMAPEQLPGKYPIKQAKEEDLPNHGSFWQLLLLLHTISIALLKHL